MKIHPSAIVSPAAEFGRDVDIGPFVIVEENVKIGDGTRLRARSHICAGTVLGKNCDIHMNAVVGHIPQDYSHKGEPVSTVLGDGVIVRENVTIHGSVGAVPTAVGDACFLMAGSHVAHNCKLGKKVLLINGALLAGHVSIGDSAIISGNAMVHQFTRVGRLAILTGGTRVGMDLPPYMICDAANVVSTLNVVGIRRAAFLTPEDRTEIKAAFKILYRSGLSQKEAMERMQAEFKGEAVRHWVEFLSFPSKRGFCRHGTGTRRGLQVGSEE